MKKLSSQGFKVHRKTGLICTVFADAPAHHHPHNVSFLMNHDAGPNPSVSLAFLTASSPAFSRRRPVDREQI